MSTKKAQGLTETPPHRHIQDVSRVWDSLMEAKHMMQRIEDKIDAGNQRRTRGQRIRRRLQLEQDLYSGRDSLVPASDGHGYWLSPQAKSEQTTSPYHSKEPSFSRRSPLVSLNGSLLSPSSKRSDIYFPDHNLSGQTVEKYNLDSSFQKTFEIEMNGSYIGETMESTQDSGSPQALNPEELVDSFLEDNSRVSHKKVQEAFTHNSSPESPPPRVSPEIVHYAQKLEFLKQRSPSRKLDRLKEKIREQKRRQEALKRNLTKPRLNLELVRNNVNMQRIRKVTFGPPAPIYKGFSVSQRERMKAFPGESALTTEKENVKKSDHRPKSCTETSRSTKENAKTLKSQNTPSKSPEKKSYLDRYNPSAWREGQKLVHQILGPSPVAFKKRRVYGTQDIPLRESCRKRIKKVGSRDQPKPYKTRQEADQGKAMLQVLRDIQAGREGPERDGENSGKLVVKNGISSRSVSPKRPSRRAPSPWNWGSGKENIEVENIEVRKRSNVRSYSVEEVRTFIKKKNVERKKAVLENQRTMQKALQTKQQQLQNVLKKQKEAFPTKRAPCNMKPQPSVAAEVDPIRRQWLHAASSDLLKEENEGRVREPAPEEPNISDCTRPLQLRDLTTAPTTHQQDPLSHIYTKESLGSECPSTEHSPYRDSQERVQALLAAAKDLGRRVEQEMNRLSITRTTHYITTTTAYPISPTRERSPAGQTAEAEKLCSPKHSDFNGRTVSASNSANKDQSPTSSRAKIITGKVDKHQGYTEEHTAQPKKSQPRFSIRGIQKPGVTAKRSPQRGSEWNKQKTRVTASSPTYDGTKEGADKGRKSAQLHHGRSAPQVRDVQHTGAEIAKKIKAQIEQQEKDLAKLRLKAEMEAREAQRCMEEMLRSNHLQMSTPRETDQQTTGGHTWMGGREATRLRLEPTPTLELPETPSENDASERSCDQTEPNTDSTSKWSEVSEFYGSPGMFTRFTLEMTQQYLREEELRARHQTGLLRLREEALLEKTKAELALLGHQRAYWEMKKERTRVEEILRQEEEIQKNLKQEQAEILHLHNIYKAAHQERKLLLKQQKEIRKIQQSAANIHQKVRNSQISEKGGLGVSRNQKRDDMQVTLLPEQKHHDTQSAISDLSADDDLITRTLKESTERSHAIVEDQSLDRSDVHSLPRHQDNRRGRNQRAAGQGGGEESNPSSEHSGRVTGRLHSPPTHQQRGPVTWREDPHHQSQEKTNTVKLPSHLAARDHGENMGHKEEKPEIQDPHSLDQKNDLIVRTSDRGSHEHVNLDGGSIVKQDKQSASSDTLLPSLAEFHKVSAKLIHISESSISFSDRVQDGQDTESGDSDVFDMESTGLLGEELINGDLVKDSPSCDMNRLNENNKDGQSKDQVSKPPMEEGTAKKAPLAYESFPTSEDVTESESKTFKEDPLPENWDSNTVRFPDQQKATWMGPGDISYAAGMSLPDTKERARVTETNAKQSVTENVIFGKIETAPFQTTAYKDLFQIKSLPHRSEGEVIFITDEVLQPAGDTLSEIFPPVDEKLSYESEDLFSAKQDQSEDLPPLPSDGDSLHSESIDTEDFPTPPEEIFFSGSESSQEESLMEEINVLYDNLLTEDDLLQTPEPLHENVEQSGSKSEFITINKPFLTLSKAEDDLHDPMMTYEIGDRVLVKLSKPGTLKYKGSVAFREGYWAGVALDKANGDNDGTCEGIRYFECPEKRGVFVRPGQISHLLFDDRSSSDAPGDNDNSPSEGPSPRNTRPPDQAGSDANRESQNSEKRAASSGKDLSQARSCCLPPSGAASEDMTESESKAFNGDPLLENRDGNTVNTKGIHVANVSRICLNSTNIDTDPLRALPSSISLLNSDVNKLMLQFLQKNKRQTVSVPDELLKQALPDVLKMLSNTSHREIKLDRMRKIIYHGETGEEFGVLYKKAHNQLHCLIGEMMETSGWLDKSTRTLLMEAIRYFIQEGDDKKKKTNQMWPSDNVSITLLA